MVRVRQYLCNKPSIGTITVQFDRLNDLAAALLFSGRAPGPLRAEFDRTKLLSNDVSREFYRLVERYGSEEPQGSSMISVSAAGGGGVGTAGLDSLPMVKVLVPAQGDIHAWDFPEPAALESVVDVATVPPRFASVGTDIANVSLIWRYMDSSDLSNYSELVSAFNRLVLSTRFGGQFKGFRTARIPPHVELYRELGRNGLPRDFITIFGERDIAGGCSDRRYWEFKFHPRHLLVDVMTIHNRSASAVTIDGFVGMIGGGAELRRPELAVPTDSEQRPISLPQAVQLAPGERLTVATRLTWVVSDAFREQFQHESAARRPAGAPYAWGRELRVAGLLVNGQPLSLQGGQANFMAITTSSGQGSCPYLHVWDQKRGWRNDGKVIDKAVGAARQMSEIRRFPGLATRFRLAEVEAEHARIDQVSLTLRLKSGKVLVLESAESVMRYVDGRYVELAMGDAVEFRFRLPAGLPRKQVVESMLSVNGYYDRYTDILAQRLGAPRKLALERSTGGLVVLGQGSAQACSVSTQ